MHPPRAALSVYTCVCVYMYDCYRGGIFLKKAILQLYCLISMAYLSQSRHMSCAKACKPLILLNTGVTRFCLGWHKISRNLRNDRAFRVTFGIFDTLY